MGRDRGRLAGLLAVVLLTGFSIITVMQGEAVAPSNQTPASNSGSPSPSDSSPPTPDPNSVAPNPHRPDANSGSEPKPQANPKPPGSKPSGDKVGATRPENTEPDEEEKEEEVSRANQGWRVDVSISRQSVKVFKDGRLQKQMLASTGTKDQPTPLGQFKIQNRGPWFFSKKYQQGGKYWVSFKNWGQYLFHSIPMDEDQNVLPEEASKLGQPASHGCIRLAIADAKWIYDHIPQGTPVNIH